MNGHGSLSSGSPGGVFAIDFILSGANKPAGHRADTGAN
jgi:hypothetical protein